MPTGFDIQKKYDALKADLSAAAVFANEGKATDIAVRSPNNTLSLMPLSADKFGVVDPAQAQDLQEVIDGLKANQDAFNTAKFAYDTANTSENVGNLSSALGEYYVT